MIKKTKYEIYNVSDDLPEQLHIVHNYAAKLLNNEPLRNICYDDCDLSSQARNFFLDNKRVSNIKIKEVLGVSLQFPTYRAGLQSLLKDLIY